LILNLNQPKGVTALILFFYAVRCQS